MYFDDRLRTFDAKHDTGKAIHNVLCHGRHSVGPGDVPKHRRAAEQVLVRCNKAGEESSGLQTHRSHRDQSDIRRLVLVQPDHRGRRDRFLQIRGLDLF